MDSDEYACAAFSLWANGVETNANIIRSLDSIAGCARGYVKISWAHDKADTLPLAEEVAERSNRFSEYLSGPTHSGYLKSLEPRGGT